MSTYDSKSIFYFLTILLRKRKFVIINNVTVYLNFMLCIICIIIIFNNVCTNFNNNKYMYSKLRKTKIYLKLKNIKM